MLKMSAVITAPKGSADGSGKGSAGVNSIYVGVMKMGQVPEMGVLEARGD